MRTSDDFDYQRERFADEINEDKREARVRQAFRKPYFERNVEDDFVIDQWVKNRDLVS